MGVAENVGCNVGENTGSSGQPIVSGPSDFNPAKHLTFENYTPGSSAEDANDTGLFNYLASDTLISTAVTAAVGTQCASFFKDAAPGAGSTAESTAGFGSWGGKIILPSTVSIGEEIWVSCRSQWPTGYDFQAEPGHLKYLRLEKTNSGSNGYYDIAIIDQTGASWCGGDHQAYRMGSEGVFSGYCISDYDTHSPVQFYDQWLRHEWYILVADDSSGIMRFYQDGELLAERTGSNIQSGAGIVSLMFHTFWNNPPWPTPRIYPANDSTSYVDNIVIATSDSPPTNTDAFGNAVIGSYTG